MNLIRLHILEKSSCKILTVENLPLSFKNYANINLIATYPNLSILKNLRISI